MTQAEMGKWLFNIIIERQKNNAANLFRARINQAAEGAKRATWEQYHERDQYDGVGGFGTSNPFDRTSEREEKELRQLETIASNYDELLKYVVEHFIDKAEKNDVALPSNQT